MSRSTVESASTVCDVGPSHSPANGSPGPGPAGRAPGVAAASDGRRGNPPLCEGAPTITNFVNSSRSDPLNVASTACAAPVRTSNRRRRPCGPRPTDRARAGGTRADIPSLACCPPIRTAAPIPVFRLHESQGRRSTPWAVLFSSTRPPSSITSIGEGYRGAAPSAR